MIWGIVLFLVVWTIASCAYIIKNLGRKHSSPGPRWKFVLVAPALVIAVILGCIGQFLHYLDNHPRRR